MMTIHAEAGEPLVEWREQEFQSSDLSGSPTNEFGHFPQVTNIPELQLPVN